MSEGINNISHEVLQPEQIPGVLERTQLSLIFKLHIPNCQPGTPIIQAAHNSTESFVIIYLEGEYTGLRMFGGTKEERKFRYWHFLEKMERQGMGGVVTPDGRQITLQPPNG